MEQKANELLRKHNLSLEDVREVSRRVAQAVAGEALRLGLTNAKSIEELNLRIDEKIWTPRYARYVRVGRTA